MPAPGDSGGQHFVGARLSVDKAEIGSLQNPASSNLVTTDADQAITGNKDLATVRIKGLTPYVDPTHPSWGLDPTGAADNTANWNTMVAAMPAGGAKIMPPAGIYKFSGNPNPPPSNTTIEGVGQASLFQFTGTGILFPFTTQTQVRFVALNFQTLNAGAASLFNLNNVFRNSWNRCIFAGTHTSGAPQLNSIGVDLNNNAGDNRFIDCDFNNLGIGLKTATAMNYMLGGVIGFCKIGAYGTGGGSAAGHSFSGVTWVSNAATTAQHVLIDAATNKWWFEQCWIEGCTTGLQVGSGANGPYSFGMVNCVIAATTADMLLNASTQTFLSNVVFEKDSGQTPTELTINAANCLEGTAINLRSFAGFDFADSVFPNGWVVLRRGVMRAPATIDTGTAGLILSAPAGGAGGNAIVAASNNANDVPLKVINNAAPSVDLLQVWSGGSKTFWQDSNQLVHMSAAISANTELYPGAEAGGNQQTGGILHSTGVPNNANGLNNDWCISDNGHLYFKSGGTWAQKI